MPASAYFGSAPDLGAFESPGTAPANTAPLVDAGADQAITLPADVGLAGTVSDDGLPYPPGALATTWSMASGPGTVTFQNASATNTRASFSAAGSYVLRLTASDGALSAADSAVITVQPSAVISLDNRVAASTDDAEESATGSLSLNSTDLELVYDGSNQWVGMRFANITIPRGTVITRAYVQFQAREAQSEVTNLSIQAQAADNAPTFAFTNKVSTRPRTVAVTNWTPGPWSGWGELGPNERTPDLSAVLQEVVNRPGWTSGNALVLVINGTGHRTAHSWDGLAAGAPLLHIETGAPPPPPNTAPVVDAGANATITLPADVALDGTVSDDGLPNPPAALTTTWSRASGPAPVSFLEANAIDTRATFGAAGTYVLRLTANDGALSATDSVVITVLPEPPPPNLAPVVDAGPNQTITLPAGAVLAGTAHDDELPDPPSAFTTTWSKGSGPGSVTFVDASALNTQASFGAAGTYVLRLTANDSALSATDSVVITVQPAPPPPNTAPVVDAGPNATITLPADAALDGTVSDDGLPNPPAALTTTWTKGSGPGTVTFQNASLVDTRATFGAAGTYVLRLTANDSALACDRFDRDHGAARAAAAQHGAGGGRGSERDHHAACRRALDGTVSDDGLPNPPGATTTSWTKGSGPGTVTFQNASLVDTRATFGAAGTYVLRLTANDSALASTDSVVITVQPAPVNTAPVVDAGPNQTITLPADAALDGTVSDDGLPNPPAALTTTWTKGSGPGTVTFQNASLVDTRATFGAAGTYVLRLTAERQRALRRRLGRDHRPARGNRQHRAGGGRGPESDHHAARHRRARRHRERRRAAQPARHADHHLERDHRSRTGHVPEHDLGRHARHVLGARHLLADPPGLRRRPRHLRLRPDHGQSRSQYAAGGGRGPGPDHHAARRRRARRHRERRRVAQSARRAYHDVEQGQRPGNRRVSQLERRRHARHVRRPRHLRACASTPATASNPRPTRS
jgi:hypothetical protein